MVLDQYPHHPSYLPGQQRHVEPDVSLGVESVPLGRLSEGEHRVPGCEQVWELTGPQHEGAA